MRNRGLLLWGSLVLVLLVGGCAEQPVAPPVEKEKQAAPAPPPPYRPPVAILVSADIPAYTDVADRLQERLGQRASRFFVSNTSDALQALSPEISQRGQIAAIGLEAAVAAKPLAQAGRSVVFCQVFNYSQDELLSERSKGVGMLPSYRELFAVWHGLAPELRRVAVFTGPGLDTMLAPAVKEASRYGIDLMPITVNSDKEFIYSYKRSGARYDGLWLIPDNRVLSRTAIREVMSFSLRNGKQVAVFNDQLLSLGGLLSVTSKPDEIASKVTQRLAAARPSGQIDGPDIINLRQAVVRINPVVAQRFTLTIPQRLQRYVVR